MNIIGFKEQAIDQSIFRAYDIRGIVDKALTENAVFQIARAIGSQAFSQGVNEIIIGRDGRLSGPTLSEALQQGLLQTGINVINIGIVATPMLYFATKILSTNSGVMLTGSHNPANYNGLKMVIDGKTLAENDIQNLYQRIQSNDYYQGNGQLTSIDITEKYLEKIVSGVSLKRLLKVVVDCGNGVTGCVAPQLLKKLGCDVIELYCDVDGNFPNHHPDPSDPKNLKTLIETVKQQNADVGIAFDGDGDRLGIVTDKGEIIWPDRQMMLFAKTVLTQNPGAQIIYDVKCTRHLADVIKQYGGQPLMWKTGHSFIKAKLAETNALLAGEMSGHTFFNDRWYGFDDGLYTAARLLEILANQSNFASEIFAKFPDWENTPELKLEIADDRKFSFMQQFIDNADFSEANISTIDGLRADFNDGWGLMRPSNTTPCLILRFEAENKMALTRIQNLFREQLFAIDDSLKLPF